MTILDMPAEKLNSTTDGDFKFLDVYGKTWQAHPDWEPGDPWEDKYVYPEDEGFQTIGWQALEWLQTYVNSPNGTGRLRLTPEQQRFLLHWYSFDPETEIPRYREGVLVRPKGAGKRSPCRDAVHPGVRRTLQAWGMVR